MSEIHKIGDAMEVVLEGDIVHVTAYKSWDYDNTVAYLKLLDDIRARNIYLFIIVANRGVLSFPKSEVRNCITEWTAKNTFSGMALYGLDPSMRIMASLMFNVVNLMRKGSAPIVFVKDEAAARRWVAARRAQLTGTPV